MTDHVTNDLNPDCVVVCIRDPDASNYYAVFGSPEPIILDIDLGHLDLSDPDEWSEWTWADDDIPEDLAGTPFDARRYVALAIHSTAELNGHRPPHWTEEYV